MDIELIRRIKNGEDSYTQFKENIFDSKKLAEEMIAFSNAEGGEILIGVADNSTILGVTAKDVSRLNQLISNTANEICKPPIYPFVEIQEFGGKKIVVVRIKKGLNKPYSTSSGLYITKSGADKRKISQEELRRLFAESGNLSADEELLHRTGLKDFNFELFYNFLEKTNTRVFEELQTGLLTRDTILENLDLYRDNSLTLAGNLLFGIHPQKFNRSFYVDCVSFDGNDVSVCSYISSDKVEGTLNEIFKQCMNFLRSNLKKIQSGDNFNSSAILEIPEEVLIEFIVNALIHRDYYIASSVKVFVFYDRVEIISPGKLPNSLTIEKIKNGLSIYRNPILNSIAKNILPYSGLGSGIKRAMFIFGDMITLVNDIQKEEFKCSIKRIE